MILLVRKRISVWALAMAAIIAGSASPAAAQGAELTLDPQSGYILPVAVNGQMLRLKVDLGAPSNIMLNKSKAEALGLSGPEGPVMTVGPVRLTARSRVTTVTIANRPLRLRVMWFNDDLVEGADGAINPAQLPYDAVVFQLRPASGGEVPIRFRALFDRERGLHHQFSFAGELLLTRFTLFDRLSTVTAAAGSLIARHRGGAWAGGAFIHKVRYNITRPARTMVLAQPFRVHGLAMNRLTVRIRDDGGNYQLPTAERVEHAAQGDTDLLVVGQRGLRLPAPAHFWLMVGTGDLEHCSSVRYDRRPHRITLMCRPHGAAPAPAAAPSRPA